jgi:hypothetical protein
MSLLDKIERRFRRFALPHLTIGLILCQVVVYGAAQADLLKAGEGGQTVLDRIALVPAKVLEGQVWRLLTFVCEPPAMNVVFAFFFWYMFYLMGEALEQNWGSFRYNVYLLIGYLATVAVSFLTPQAPASIGFLEVSVFLAFAALFPDFVIYLFFLLPVKIKWLALLAWIGYFFALVSGTWATRLLVLASICNFLLFFSKDIIYRLQRGRRSMALQAARIGAKPKPYFHRCTVCGITDRSHPQASFRYCRQCDGHHGYCMEHLRNHEHIKTERPP